MSPTLRRLVVVALLLGWCAFLIAARWAWTGRPAFGFLAWNLFLAALPAVASTFFGRAVRAGRPAWVGALWFAGWLLFLPNAPYIVTDFLHLHEWPGVPLWFDIALLTSAAGTGLMLGYASTAEVHRVVAARVSPAAGWAVACAAQLLSGFGIYLGRFLRWNSWDVVADPLGRLADLVTRGMHPAQHPRTLAVTFVYGVGLALGYVALRAIVHAEGESDRAERPPD